VRAWVTTGKHALPADQARAALPKVTPKSPKRRARFRLGVWLRDNGRASEGDRQMDAASGLHPQSWSMWRQAADLDEVGKASGPTSGNACKRWGIGRIIRRQALGG